MGKLKESLLKPVYYFWMETGFGMRTKLLVIFLIVSVFPLVLLSTIALRQYLGLSGDLSHFAAEDAAQALNRMAIENIERMTTDRARMVADFLYARDRDILYLAGQSPSEETYSHFIGTQMGRLHRQGEWVLSPDGNQWQSLRETPSRDREGISSNIENNDMEGFRSRPPDTFIYDLVPLYDEITFFDLEGNELIKVTAPLSPKTRFPLSPELRNVSQRENTYVRAESYFEKLSSLGAGEIYVSDVIGAYVPSHYIGMYTPENVAAAAEQRNRPMVYAPEVQAYAGMENPLGRRFEGIIRWVSPVLDTQGEITGYVSFALNHDHIMEFVDHITPMEERYTELPNAFEGNYAFIWDYLCRSIAHPRHHSIVGFDPDTGEPQVPWLETSIYQAWRASGMARWNEFILPWPWFDSQSRSKTPAQELTWAGLVGLDGRYLNQAPQCTGWMDLTQDGGSGSFYIMWSNLYKLTTAAAIPYYTGQYAPSAANDYSRRGFGIVTIGAGLDDFTHPATVIGHQIEETMNWNLNNTAIRSFLTLLITLIFVILITIQVASFLTNNINKLVTGVSRFKAGERHFRFNAPVKDEFSILAEAFDRMADNIEESQSDPLVITNMRHRVIYMNQEARQLLGKTLEEVTRMSYDEVSLYPQGTRYDPIEALEQGGETEAFFHEKANRYYRGVAHYFLDNRGKRIGYIITSNDVTDIQIAREAADQASRAKGDFLSNMSHEIRTPLNAIIGMTSMGASATELDRKDYCLSRISEASKHLLGVINDILDMSKIEANKLELSPEKFNFERMLQRAMEVVGFRVDEKQQQFTVHIDKHIPPMIISDEQRLAQVITNLLSNAIKFTPINGTIHLDAKLVSESGDFLCLEISVTDTGIGITEEQMSRLFRVFEQAEHSTSRKFGGTGLGLTISKRIVEMMGGEIWVTSEPGKGSVFGFTIQAMRGEENREGLLAPGVNWKNVSILAVDDNGDVQDFFRELGQQFKINCDVATSGEEALALIKAHGNYDIYFVDWNMPGMDGTELSKKINENHPGKHVINMISSVDWDTVEREAKEAGVDRFLPKPLFSSAIVDCINECLGKPEDLAREAELDDFKGFRVLLAEDVEINREIVLALLEPTQLEIDCAENGAQAVELFKANPKRYHIIFMDLQMPEVDGLEATRRIRAIEEELSIEDFTPIVAMTANVFREDIENCLAAGMNDHLGKPLDFEEVMVKLRRYLSKSRLEGTG
ncbi:MAG: response regulator [Treponema sp.]|nr:response regulator [Treponema sp.]